MNQDRRMCGALALGMMVAAGLSGCTLRPQSSEKQLEARERWRMALERVGDHLDELSASGAVVLWRPLHAMNTGAFWWDGVEDPEGFKALWRHMHRYLTTVRGLDGLIWVFAPRAESDSLSAYYPGDDVVDIVGPTVYLEGVEGQLGGELTEVFGLGEAVGKPVGLSEFGLTGCRWPREGGGESEVYDYRDLLESLERYDQPIAYFMAWDQCHAMRENAGAVEVMADSRVLDRDALSSEVKPGSSTAEGVLKWMQEQQNSRWIAGQFFGYGDEETEEGYANWVEGLKEDSGVWPGMLGADFGTRKQPREDDSGYFVLRNALSPPQLALTQERLIAHGTEGGWLSVSWHAENPWTQRDAWDCSPSERASQVGCQDQGTYDLSFQTLLSEAQ